MRSVGCEVWSVKFEVWSAKSAVQCEVWSVEGRTRSGQVVFEHRSFMKLPPPACPGLCYTVALDSETQPRETHGSSSSCIFALDTG